VNGAAACERILVCNEIRFDGLRTSRTGRTARIVGKKTYDAEEARAKLPELLERAHRGLPTVITKRGQPYAALPPGDARARQTVSTLMSPVASKRSRCP